MSIPLTTLAVKPGGTLTGRLRVPGDKSISHRAIMLSAIADGISTVSDFLQGADTLATLAAFQAMGVAIEQPAPANLRIHGVGRDGLSAPPGPLQLGNSGTSMRLLAGLLAGQPFDSELTGDPSLSQRPMRRVTEPLSRMGAHVRCSENGTAPLLITGGRTLQGIEYTMPVASGQVKSSLLLAGLYAQGRTCVIEPLASRDHTERMLRYFGYPVSRQSRRVCVQGGGTLKATEVPIPGDLSSAAFFLVGATIAPGSDLVLESVGVNPTRTGILDVLRMMGADICLCNERHQGGEPVADLRVRSAKLRGIMIPEDLVPLTIDEFPALFVAAACADGEFVLKGAGELRVKESDRIQAMAEGLRALEIEATPTTDGIIIRGGALGGGSVNSHGDHRVAMAFATAALRAREPIRVLDCDNVNTSYPDFIAHARRIGLDVRNESGL